MGIREEDSIVKPTDWNENAQVGPLQRRAAVIKAAQHLLAVVEA